MCRAALTPRACSIRSVRRRLPHYVRGCRVDLQATGPALRAGLPLLKAGVSALSRWWLALAGESTRLRTGLAIE